MSDERKLADYADMRRTMERVNRVHVLDGSTCPHPDCEGTIRKTGGNVACDTCGRLIASIR